MTPRQRVLKKYPDAYCKRGVFRFTVWRRRGAQVTVVEFLDRITPGIDGEVAKNFQRILAKQGMTFKLSNGATVNAFGGSFVSLTLRPGSGSAAGEAELEAQFPKAQGYLSGSKWFKVPGFSDKAQSTVAVTIVKQGERLEVFLNKAKVFESDKAVPAGLLFNQLWMDHQGRFDENSRMYISNVSILKK